MWVIDGVLDGEKTHECRSIRSEITEINDVTGITRERLVVSAS